MFGWGIALVDAISSLYVGYGPFLGYAQIIIDLDAIMAELQLA
jgi:hypothetical protein